MIQRKHQTFTYLDIPSREPQSAPLLVMLHGYGSNEKDLIRLAPSLDPRLHIISVRAPQQLDYEMFGWFPLEFTANGIIVDRAAAGRAKEQFIGFLSEIVDQYRPAGDRVFLMGFSQGAVMNYLTAFNAPELLHGVIALSGQLPDYQPSDAAVLEKLHDIPFLVVHGLYDEVLPVEKGRAAFDWLKTTIGQIEYREYPMAHQINQEALELVDSWLREQIDRSIA
jgi:phospholipase/carboxylesterase